jgi:hypothetical protein
MIQTAVAPSPVIPKKVFARVMLVNLDEPSAHILRDCFRQFGIRTVVADGDAANRLGREKFEACVVRLSDASAAGVLEAARTSASNSRIVIYGIANNTPEALRFSKYGINAMLDSPVDRQSALKVVRATHLLVVHELRRYVRLPIVTEVDIIADDVRFKATSQEISAGGMSMESTRPVAKEQVVVVTFALTGMTNPITVRASVCWVRADDFLFGIRFDPADPERLHVKRWIDNYLDIG